MPVKIAVTGLGIVSCIGQNTKVVWDNVTNGVSGITEHPNYPNQVIKTKKVGHIPDFKLDAEFNPRWRQKIDRHVQFGLNAAKQAVDQSGLEINKMDPSRIHTVMGTCMGGYDFINENQNRVKNGNPVLPGFLAGHVVNMMSSYINMHYGIQGSGLAVGAACAGGNSGLAIAAMMIETGLADVVVAGASECWLNDICIGGFESLGALSLDDVMPRPFDIDRSGFAISEGSAVLILESEEHARRRSANILCYMSGWGISSDADHPTSPAESGLAATKAINLALAKAKLTHTDIDYINAHATGTKVGDAVECQMLQKIFGSNPYISATKSMHGHSIGSVSLIESVISILSLTNNQVPGTINLKNIDTKCPGNHVTETIDGPLTHVVNNSFGFGGANAIVIFSKE
jgi:3-oxoacyl-[acyl-carrier-protein] synthase II